MTSEVIYLGDLRTKATHLQSGDSIITDAPIDNQGKGEAFSPTDLCATSLASCILTIMGIKARDQQIDMAGTIGERRGGVSPRMSDRGSRPRGRDRSAGQSTFCRITRSSQRPNLRPDSGTRPTSR